METKSLFASIFLIDGARRYPGAVERVLPELIPFPHRGSARGALFSNYGRKVVVTCS